MANLPDEFHEGRWPSIFRAAATGFKFGGVFAAIAALLCISLPGTALVLLTKGLLWPLLALLYGPPLLFALAGALVAGTLCTLAALLSRYPSETVALPTDGLWPGASSIVPETTPTRSELLHRLFKPEESIADPTVSLGKLDVSETDRIVELLAQGFEDDPAYLYTFGSLSQSARKHWMRVGMRVITELTFQHGMVIGARASGKTVAVALWYPPHSPYPPPQHRVLLSTMRLLPLIMHMRAYYRLCRLYEASIQLKPRHLPHWYLAALAVDKADRSRGLGTLLVQDGLARAAAHETPLLLHCWSATLPFYTRLGFTTLRSKALPEIAQTLYVLVDVPNRTVQHSTSTICPYRHREGDDVLPPHH